MGSSITGQCSGLICRRLSVRIRSALPAPELVATARPPKPTSAGPTPAGCANSGSSNGRTPAFEAEDVGSTPTPGTKTCAARKHMVQWFTEMARGAPGVPRRHPSGCGCAFHSGRRNHKLDCQCVAHRGKGKRGIGGVKIKPLNELLIQNGQTGKAQRIKKRLIEEGLKIDVCEQCGLGPWWQDKELVLQLDHKNGNAVDWRLENLEIICPNCHTQTLTFAGRNARG